MENETSFQDMISIILTITFLLFSYNEVMPRVSYLKALDIWLAVCFMIVFLSLIKLAIMKYMRQRLRVDMATGTRAVPTSLLGGMLPLIQLGTGGPIPYGYGSGGFGLFPQRASLMASHRSIDGTLRRPPTPPQQMRSSFQMPNSVATHTHRPSGRTLRSTGGSSAEEEQKRRQSQRSTISQGLQMTLGGACIPQMVAQQNVVRRKRSSESPVQPSISTLAASQMHLPLNESSLRQLQQQTLYQAHQQLQLQVQLEQARLLHQAQLQALQEQRARERRARRERAEHKKAKQEQEQLQQMRQRKAATKRPTTLQQAVDANDNVLQMPRASASAPKIKGRAATSRPHHQHHLRRSPVNAIRVGIETTSSSSTSDADGNHSSTDSETGDARRTAPGEGRLFFGLFDQFGNVEFSASFMRRFHWVTQMSFFFFFVLFCLYFFLVYPNSRSTNTDPACKREEAEWFASIPV